MQAFRIHVTLEAISTAATSWPITFFVKKQNTGSALSFSVPIQREGYVNSSSLIKILDMIVASINPWCMRRRVTVIILSVCVCLSVGLSVTTNYSDACTILSAAEGSGLRARIYERINFIS